MKYNLRVDWKWIVCFQRKSKQESLSTASDENCTFLLLVSFCRNSRLCSDRSARFKIIEVELHVKQILCFFGLFSLSFLLDLLTFLCLSVFFRVLFNKSFKQSRTTSHDAALHVSKQRQHSPSRCPADRCHVEPQSPSHHPDSESTWSHYERCSFSQKVTICVANQDTFMIPFSFYLEVFQVPTFAAT